MGIAKQDLVNGSVRVSLARLGVVPLAHVVVETAQPDLKRRIATWPR